MFLDMYIKVVLSRTGNHALDQILMISVTKPNRAKVTSLSSQVVEVFKKHKDLL